MPFDATPIDDLLQDVALLRMARKGIAKPGGWCTGVLNDGRAHCAVGWLIVASRKADGAALARASELAVKYLYPELPAVYHMERRFGSMPDILRKTRAITSFNDKGRQADAVALFDRAIAKLEERYAV